jgi:outer membrane protein insertion porin family
MDPTLLDANGSPQFRSVNVPTLAYRVTFPGGDTQAVLNAEYRIPIAGPVAIGLFNDLGTVGVLKRDQLALDPTNVSNLNSQFPGANLGAQLGVAENTNFHLRSSAGVELVVNLPIVQAPFRLYWSYNYRRVAEQVIAPPNVFNIPTSITRGLPLDTYQTQIVPQINALQANTSRINYFEALSTFRFTVSRTF